MITDINRAYSFTVWTQPYYTNEKAEVVDRYNNPVYLFLKDQELTWNGNICATADYLMQNHSTAFLDALKNAVLNPCVRNTLDRCWTGNLYIDSAVYIACVVETPEGDIPFCAYRMRSRSHAGYCERTVRLNKS